MSHLPDDMYRWHEIRDDALRGANDNERANIGALLLQIGKALRCLVTFADKDLAVRRAVPHLEEALRIAKNTLLLKRSA